MAGSSRPESKRTAEEAEVLNDKSKDHGEDKVANADAQDCLTDLAHCSHKLTLYVFNSSSHRSLFDVTT